MNIIKKAGLSGLILTLALSGNAMAAEQSRQNATHKEPEATKTDPNKPDPSWVPETGLADATKTAVWPAVQKVTTLPNGSAVSCIYEPSKAPSCIAFGTTSSMGEDAGSKPGETAPPAITWLYTESIVKTPLILINAPNAKPGKNGHVGIGNTSMEAIVSAGKKENEITQIGCSDTCVYVIPASSPQMNAISSEKSLAITIPSNKDTGEETLYVPSTQTIKMAMDAWKALRSKD